MSNASETCDEWCVLIVADGLLENGEVGDDIVLKKEIALPRALLPVCGIPLLDYWYQRLKNPSVSAKVKGVYVLSSQRDYSQFVQYAITRKIPTSNIIIDKNIPSTIHPSGITDLLFALSEREEDFRNHNVLLVAGDVLVTDEAFDIQNLLTRTTLEETCITVTHIASPTSTNDPHSAIVNETHATIATPLVVAHTLSRRTLHTLTQYHPLPAPSPSPPYSLLQWLIENTSVSSKQALVTDCIRVHSLQAYHIASQQMTTLIAPVLATLPQQATYTCPARIGLMGNPSDGFNGKTISFLLHNFAATVTITSPPSNQPHAIELVPHPEYDRSNFMSLDHLHHVTVLNVRMTRVYLLCFFLTLILSPLLLFTHPVAFADCCHRITCESDNMCFISCHARCDVL